VNVWKVKKGGVGGEDPARTGMVLFRGLEDMGHLHGTKSSGVAGRSRLG
jgi:hypothetical protein